MTLRRPHALIASLLLLLIAGCGDPGLGAVREPEPQEPSADLSAEAFLDQLEERTFRFFWETTNPDNGLVHDRYPTPAFSSIAAVGFGLTAYPIGVERGWVSREQARERVLTTLRFLHDAPQGPDARGMTGYKGFFYHFVDMNTGERFKDVELSTVDSALLLGGVLFCGSYFDGDHPDEAAIRELSDVIYRRVDWRWAQVRKPAISHGWRPENGFIEHDWLGYNEAMLVYILALGSPTHPVEPDAWATWTRNYDRTWGTHFGQEHLGFAPHFGHQYSHVWIDFRGIQDDYMRRRGIDYFENSRRATYAQKAYAAANPGGWQGYGGDIWGLTACDGPANVELPYRGQQVTFRAYSARGINADPNRQPDRSLGQNDDGTIAPTAVVASIPFAPELAIPATVELERRFGEHIYSKYGFRDSFNPSFQYDVEMWTGSVIPGFGWVAADYLGIDQGPIVAMIENHRSELVWRVMRKNPYIREGLTRAGFQGGWLSDETSEAVR